MFLLESWGAYECLSITQDDPERLRQLEAMHMLAEELGMLEEDIRSVNENIQRKY